MRLFYDGVMDVSKIKIPANWPPDAQDFAREAISEIQELKSALKQALFDIISIKEALEKSQSEIRELKAKLGTNSSNSGLPPSKNPPGAPTVKIKPTGRQ